MEEEKLMEGEPEEAAAPTLEQQLAEAKKEAAEFKDNWMRAVADLQNYRKRIERERADIVEWSNGQLILQLLDVMDGFEAAFKVIPEKFRSEAWVEGIRLIQQKMRKMLETWNVKPIETIGKPFDPNFHEAMWHEVSEGHTEGEVIGEFQRGYLMGDRVLRPARVKVAKGEGNPEGASRQGNK